MKLLILNGPNLNMLGIREPEIYGRKTFADLSMMIEEYCAKNRIDARLFQSNHEGDLVDVIQEAYGDCDGIVINPGAYTHTSVAILDALKAVALPTVEVHISDVDAREEFRKRSYVSLYAEKKIAGHGFDGYIEAIDYLTKKYGK